MTGRRRKISTSDQAVPEAVRRIIDLVITLTISRRKVSEIGGEPTDVPPFQLLIETAARLIRAGESTYTAADKAWSLIDDCTAVHRAKRKERLRSQDEHLLRQIPQQVIYNDAIRIVTEEKRIDRAADKFQRFLRYYHHGGTKIQKPEEYLAWQKAVSEYNLVRVNDLETEFSLKPSDRVEEYKATGINSSYLQYLRSIFWGWQYQQFLRLADPVEKGRSGRMGGRGKKKA